MLEINEYLSKYQKITLVDVGHHKGHFAAEFSQKIAPLNKYLYVVAIDPINYESGWNNLFIQKAISTTVGKRKFHTYSEPGCNSLSEMLLENKFQRPQHIERTGEIEVECATLDSVLEQVFFRNEIINYLKIDAQGNDLDVIKSGESWLNRCLFIQLETCVAKSSDTLMYKNQNTRDSDIEYMLSKGFELYDEWDHSQVSCPEADLIFFNRELHAKS